MASWLDQMFADERDFPVELLVHSSKEVPASPGVHIKGAHGPGVAIGRHPAYFPFYRGTVSFKFSPPHQAGAFAHLAMFAGSVDNFTEWQGESGPMAGVPDTTFSPITLTPAPGGGYALHITGHPLEDGGDFSALNYITAVSAQYSILLHRRLFIPATLLP
jgi:hypothetical protein